MVQAIGASSTNTGYAVRTAAEEQALAANSALNQKDFLTLLTAQMQNQDPLQPMENGEFLAQMAQFSTVAGIEKINATLTSLTSGIRESRIATASNLLGHQVLVPGNIARADADGAIHGAVDLPGLAESVMVTFENATTGEVLHKESYGAQSSGLMGFSWSGMPEELVQSRQPIRVSVSMATASGTQQVGPSVYARVVSATAGGVNSNDVTLQIEDYGALNALEVESFR